MPDDELSLFVQTELRKSDKLFIIMDSCRVTVGVMVWTCLGALMHVFVHVHLILPSSSVSACVNSCMGA